MQAMVTTAERDPVEKGNMVGVAKKLFTQCTIMSMFRRFR
jgi:hypothetical protein